MTVATYGEHTENGAEAFNALIRADVIPADERAVDQLLHCRGPWSTRSVSGFMTSVRTVMSVSMS